MKRLFALRAATCAKNSAESIAESVVAMCSELFTRNNLSGDDIVSLQFSLTSDLDEINPCAALRKNYSGSVDVSRIPLFCTQEAVVKNALPRVIRLIAHVYMEESAAPVHVYTRRRSAPSGVCPRIRKPLFIKFTIGEEKYTAQKNEIVDGNNGMRRACRSRRRQKRCVLGFRRSGKTGI